MAQKLLNIIQRFSQNDLSDFLKKHGYDELEDVLNKGEITDGEKFLNLNELQIIKWRLPPATKKKLLTFLKEVKENPEKFVEDTEKHILNRRQSMRSTHTNIKVKLEKVFIAPKPIENKIMTKPNPTENRINKKPIPTPIEDEPSSPNEYLAMDKPPEVSEESHYDESGYLVPTQPSLIIEENDYEPPPSDKKVINFGPPQPKKIPVFERAPLALPRESTDGSYIFGPEDLASEDEVKSPPLFPRVQKKTGLSSTKVKAPSSTPPRQIPLVVHNDDEEEAVDYEPVDDYEEDSGKSSSDMQSTGSDSGTIKRFFNFLKRGKNSDMNLSDQNLKTNSKTSRGNSPIPKSPERELSVKDRPLPPLPRRPTVPLTQNLRTKKHDPTIVYENTKKDDIKKVINEPVTSVAKRLETNISYHKNNVKSRSENDLAKDKDEENATYGNIDNEDSEQPNYGNIDNEDAVQPNYGNVDTESVGKPKYPESYEHYVPENPKTCKIKLPLPPTFLPQIQLSTTDFRCDNTQHEESEDYGTYKFNLNNERFFRNTDRKGARVLLRDMEDGAFLFRPSKKFFLTLSLAYQGKCFNLGILKTENNKIHLNTEGLSVSPEFSTLTEFENYFIREVLSFEHQGRVIETYLKRVLPPDKF